MRRPAELLAGLAAAVALAGCLSSTSGEALEVFGPYTDREADLFAEVIAAFEEEAGIDVRYTGSAALSPDLARRITSGDLPDVIILPQPGTLRQLVRSGEVELFEPALASRVLDVVGPGWEDAITWNGVVVAVPYRVVVKSLVWYRPDEFVARGYEVPTTLDQLDELAARMQGDGISPWCAGMNDFASTGWWGTDWVEDLVLRTAGEQTYDSWARLNTPFDSPDVVAAIARVQRTIGSEGSVAGGQRSILNTLIPDAIDPMFEASPGCLMYKQASFQASWLPSGHAVGDGTVDVFPFPSVDGGAPPLVIGGEVAAVTSDRPEGLRFVEFLLSDEAETPWREVGGSLIPRAEPDALDRSPLDQRLITLLEAAPAVVFDASDLMPREIGSGVFWQGMIDMVGGASPEAVAGRIQSAVDALP